jgi:hypothetical protein
MAQASSQLGRFLPDRLLLYRLIPLQQLLRFPAWKAFSRLGG